jgi:hypothetical protein
MKLIFGFITLVLAVVLTGGIYLFVRKDEGKKSDLATFKAIPTKAKATAAKFGQYLTSLFASKPAADTAQAA